MRKETSSFCIRSEKYINNLSNCFDESIYGSIEFLANDLLEIWKFNRNLFICGNGGSAANAIHMANDFHYGAGACGKESNPLPGINVEALPGNQAIMSCLSNDIGYENVFSHQLQVKGRPGDLLIVLSGSGNSVNIVNALEAARKLSIKSYAILAFSGGNCLEKADVPIHFPIDDMQIAEDTQLIIGHICMQWLTENKPNNLDQLWE
tara:strand:+ start:187 stop:807 length:621 start_codon:yes stop_codon:yes gene_type:complete